MWTQSVCSAVNPCNLWRVPTWLASLPDATRKPPPQAVVVHYHACVPGIRPITYKMQAGIAVHTDEPKRAARRSLERFGGPDGQRLFDVAILSKTLSLSGQIDEVIDTDTELIPVDYKLAHKAGFHFKIQLAAYALLLEEQHNVIVSRGFLYLIPRREMVEVPITLKLRKQVQQMLEEMALIATSEHMPPATDWRQHCADCEFRRFCNDV
jgi:CRISPR-associated exonuclease Cas4